jgi:hypothetical protein
MPCSRQAIDPVCHCPSARRTEEKKKYGKKDKKMKMKEIKMIKLTQ